MPHIHGATPKKGTLCVESPLTANAAQDKGGGEKMPVSMAGSFPAKRVFPPRERERENILSTIFSRNSLTVSPTLTLSLYALGYARNATTSDGRFGRTRKQISRAVCRPLRVTAPEDTRHLSQFRSVFVRDLCKLRRRRRRRNRACVHWNTCADHPGLLRSAGQQSKGVVCVCV